jgi:hypothetical protein
VQPTVFAARVTQNGTALLHRYHAMSFRPRSLLPMSTAQNSNAAPSPAPTMYLPWHDDGRRCVHCRWVEVLPTRGMGCLCPKCLNGQASPERTCCSYEREPGSDDDLS